MTTPFMVGQAHVSSKEDIDFQFVKTSDPTGLGQAGPIDHSVPPPFCKYSLDVNPIV